MESKDKSSEAKSKEEGIEQFRFFCVSVLCLEGQLFLLRELCCTSRLALLEHLEDFLQSLLFFLSTFDLSNHLPLHLLQTLLALIGICKNQLQADSFNVSHRIDATIHMCNVLIIEASNDVNDCICIADVSQELVAQALSFRGTPYKSRDVDVLNHLVDNFFGVG